MLTSRIHQRKPMHEPVSKATARLLIRTIGLASAEQKLTLCNLAYNFNRLIFYERLESKG
tara:strand:+ start:1497 stop:1676 length:180 start_codon:yes stop_codon:yes gene_type:complete